MRFTFYFLLILLFTSCGIIKNNKKTIVDNDSLQKDSSLVINLLKDSDGDGILDDDDNCPSEYGFFENKGCPLLLENYEKNEEIIIRKNEHYEEQIKKEKIENKSNLKVEDKVITPIKVDENITPGIMAYSIPEEMKVGYTYNIKLRISKENNKVQLIQGDRNITINDTTVSSIVTIESIRVEPIMSANLVGDENSFEIKSLSTEVQNIENHGYTEWQWLIKPLKGGDNFLKLVVKVRVKEDGQDFYKDITVFDKKIAVKSNTIFTIKSFLSKYWQWIMTTIIIPLIIWLYKKRSEDKKNDKSSKNKK